MILVVLLPEKNLKISDDILADETSNNALTFPDFDNGINDSKYDENPAKLEVPSIKILAEEINHPRSQDKKPTLKKFIPSQRPSVDYSGSPATFINLKKALEPLDFPAPVFYDPHNNIRRSSKPLININNFTVKN